MQASTLPSAPQARLSCGGESAGATPPLSGSPEGSTPGSPAAHASSPFDWLPGSPELPGDSASDGPAPPSRPHEWAGRGAGAEAQQSVVGSDAQAQAGRARGPASQAGAEVGVPQPLQRLSSTQMH